MSKVVYGREHQGSDASIDKAEELAKWTLSPLIESDQKSFHSLMDKITVALDEAKAENAAEVAIARQRLGPAGWYLLMELKARRIAMKNIASGLLPDGSHVEGAVLEYVENENAKIDRREYCVRADTQVAKEAD